MNIRLALRALGLVALTLALTLSISVAAEVGSSGDPLVTLSYLNEGFYNTIMGKVDAKINERNAALSQQLGQGAGTGGTSSAFQLVTLTQGQTLSLPLGSEVLLRIGTASCVADSTPGLVDSTSGGTINSGGGLEKNHLYMATIENRGLKATAATVKVLVRGAYTIA